MLSSARQTWQCSCASSSAVLSGNWILLPCLQPSVLLLPRDCGTKWFIVLSLREGKETGQALSPSARQPFPALTRLGGLCFSGSMRVLCAKQLRPGFPQQQQQHLRVCCTAACQPHSSTNSQTRIGTQKPFPVSSQEATLQGRCEGTPPPSSWSRGQGLELFLF